MRVTQVHGKHVHLHTLCTHSSKCFRGLQIQCLISTLVLFLFMLNNTPALLRRVISWPTRRTPIILPVLSRLVVQLSKISTISPSPLSVEISVSVETCGLCIYVCFSVLVRRRTRTRERETETDRDRQRQTETDRDREWWW
jgi:hypothetical protein